VGMLGPLGKLMDNPKSAVRKEACWAASNITAGNSTQVQGIIDSGIMNKLIKAAQTDLFEVLEDSVEYNDGFR
jgi:importin subunit alpha-6/7